MKGFLNEREKGEKCVFCRWLLGQDYPAVAHVVRVFRGSGVQAPTKLHFSPWLFYI